MKQLENKQILILRGNGGRDYFAEQATLRGANVDTLECYRREPINYNNEEQTSIYKRSGVDTVVVTSLDILQALIDFVPEQEQDWLKSCRLITVSPRLVEAAKRNGWQNTTLSPKADNQSLLNTLLS